MEHHGLRCRSAIDLRVIQANSSFSLFFQFQSDFVSMKYCVSIENCFSSLFLPQKREAGLSCSFLQIQKETRWWLSKAVCLILITALRSPTLTPAVPCWCSLSLACPPSLHSFLWFAGIFGLKLCAHCLVVSTRSEHFVFCYVGNFVPDWEAGGQQSQPTLAFTTVFLERLALSAGTTPAQHHFLVKGHSL